MRQDQNCAERVSQAWDCRKAGLEIFMNRRDQDEDPEQVGLFHEYALAFDYVCPYTWADQTQGYWRYQISYGGPSEEIRIYGDVIDEYKAHMIRAEFWFLDWGDGACIDVSREKCVRWLFDDFVETGTLAGTYKAGMEDCVAPLTSDGDDEEATT